MRIRKITPSGDQAPAVRRRSRSLPSDQPSSSTFSGQHGRESMTTGIVQIEPRHAGAFMVSEAPGRLSRDRFVVALNQLLAAGQVVGKTAVTGLVTSSAAADGSNTGNGVITMDAAAPVAAGAKNGVYRAVNELVATNSGEFVVYDPDGIEIGRVAVAATFSNQIKFVIADGSTDFAIGDAFSITVRRP